MISGAADTTICSVLDGGMYLPVYVLADGTNAVLEMPMDNSTAAAALEYDFIVYKLLVWIVSAVI